MPSLAASPLPPVWEPLELAAWSPLLSRSPAPGSPPPEGPCPWGSLQEPGLCRLQLQLELTDCSALGEPGRLLPVGKTGVGGRKPSIGRGGAG